MNLSIYSLHHLAFKGILSFFFVFRHQDWDAIAEELGTNRSGYQCFIVYQNKLNCSLRRNNWDPEEDTKLIQIVEKYRIGEYIPWGKVCFQLYSCQLSAFAQTISTLNWRYSLWFVIMYILSLDVLTGYLSYGWTN